MISGHLHKYRLVMSSFKMRERQNLIVYSGLSQATTYFKSSNLRLQSCKKVFSYDNQLSPVAQVICTAPLRTRKSAPAPVFYFLFTCVHTLIDRSAE